MIDTIVFDVGNVLVEWNYSDYLDGLGFSPETKAAVINAVFENPVWNKLDQGTVSAEDALTSFISAAPEYEPEIRKAFAGCDACIHLFPYSVDWIKKKKKKGYRVLILSNYSEYLFEKTKGKMAFLPLMDGTLFSYRYKMVKPDAEIYRQLISMFDLVPEHTVFIDDRKENVDAAAAFGIHPVQFFGYEDARKKLEALGVTCH